MNKPLLYTLAIAAIAFTQSHLSIGSLQWQQAAKLDASRLAFYYSRKFAAFGLFPVERKRIEYKGLYRFFERCKGSDDGNSCLASYRHFDNGGAAGFGLAAARNPECPAAPFARALRRAVHLAQKNPHGADLGEAVILRRSAVFPKPGPCPGSAQQSNPKAPHRRF